MKPPTTVTPGQTIDTDAGPMAIAGCSSWPHNHTRQLRHGDIVSAVDDSGTTRFFAFQGRRWAEVMEERQAA